MTEFDYSNWKEQRKDECDQVKLQNMISVKNR